ncbi:MAG: MarR family transcriptional regulator [Rhodoblastus sp.]|nr:MarR family transcriptional regulator [Rhodoblastus sp.]
MTVAKSVAKSATKRAARPVAKSASDPQPTTPVDALVARRVLILSNVLRRAAALRYRRLLDISVGEWGALAELGLRAPCTLNELARGLALDKTRLSRTVSALERRGIVQRRVNPRDNRETLISLTRSGERAYARMIAAAQTTNDALLAPFSVDERAQLEALVDRLALRAREILAHEQDGALDSGR